MTTESHLPDPLAPLRRALGIIVVALGGFALWAGFAPLVSGAVAHGVVAAAGRNAIIEVAEGGVLTQLLVRDGDTVSAGQVIAYLDSTRALANFTAIRAQTDAARLTLARLEAERDGLAEFRVPADILEVGDPPRNPDETAHLLMTERDAFVARAAEHKGRLDLMEGKAEQLRRQMVGQQGQKQALSRQLEVLRQQLRDITALTARGYARRSQELALASQLAATEGEEARLLADMARAEQALNDLALEKLGLDEARRSKLIAEIDSTRLRLAELTERQRVAADQLARTAIRAPVSGVISNLVPTGPGAVLTPGQAMAQVVPVDEALVIRAEIDPLHIDRVTPGQLAELRFPGLDQRNMPRITGELKQIAPDAVEDRRLGRRYYPAEISIDRRALEGVLTLRPGMPVEVLIVAGRRTALDYLLGPAERMLGSAFHER